MVKEELELQLETLIVVYNINREYKRRYKYGDGRKHFDFAWPELKVGVEVQEEIYHKQWEKMKEDALKANWAVMNNWKLLHVTGLILRKEPDVFMDCLKELVGTADIGE